MFVADRMTKSPITVTPGTTMDEAVYIMKHHKIRNIPVAENGHLVGFLSEKDLLKASPSTATTLSRFEIKELLAKIRVGDIIPRTVFSIKADATIEEAALSLAEHRISGLPVVDDNGSVIGVLTETDVLHSFVDIMYLTSGTTRITVEAENHPGVLAEIAGAMAEKGINIDSLVTCKKGGEKYDVIIRGNFPPAEVNDILAAKGFKVTHTVRIGEEYI